MHFACFIVYCAILIKGVALILFIRQRRYMRSWIFWNLLAMFVVMMARMWMLAEDQYALAKYACIFIALEVLFAVVYFQQQTHKNRKAMEEMDGQNKTLAHQLAEHMASTRQQIQYYEDNAARAGITLWKDKAGK